MIEAVYILCALTSLACAALLARGYLRSRARLLLWSSLCFACLAVNNLLLVMDLVLLGDNLSLALPRQVMALIGLLVLLYGLIWDTE